MVLANIEVVVTDVVPVTALITRFHFTSTSGQPLPAFSGGAHIIIEMHDGSTMHRTPYSLMSSPLDTSDYQVSIRRDDSGRGSSQYMHQQVRVGMQMHVSYPVNLFALDLRANKHLMIAGGIGITPFMAQIHQLNSLNAPVELHYSARTEKLCAYRYELEQLLNDRLHLYLDDQCQRIDLDAALGAQPLGTHIYVCGPASMIDDVISHCRATGWPESHIHVELFGQISRGESFSIELHASHRTLRVEKNQSMLEAMELAGIPVPYQCRGGVCGRCETRVVSCDGKLIHNDHWLEKSEQNKDIKVMPCVSRFSGRRLLLDR